MYANPINKNNVGGAVHSKEWEDFRCRVILTFDFDILNKFEANVRSQHPIYYTNGHDEDISFISMFCWMLSPEGIDFWNNINTIFETYN